MGCRELRLGALPFLASQKNREANRVRNCCHGNDLNRESQRARNIDDGIDGEENRRERHGGAKNGGDPQPNRSPGTNRAGAKERNREQRSVNNSIEDIRSIIDQLKCFLNAGADLACDGNSKRQGADENH